MTKATLQVFVYDSIQVSDAYNKRKSICCEFVVSPLSEEFVFIRQLFEGVQYLPNPPCADIVNFNSKTTANW